MIPSFTIRSLHQIEMTSRCNLRCRYCPHPHMLRPKLDMDERTYFACLSWAAIYVGYGGQRELNLAGIGESTLHPEFARYVSLARKAVGWDCDLILATNGLLMTPELAREIAPTKIKVWVSMHRPEKAGPAIEALKSAGILSGVSADPSLAAIDWAGQVKWFRSAPEMRCQWVPNGRVFVMADGRVSSCCLDANSTGVIGTVFDDLKSLQTKPYKLCQTCEYKLSLPNYAQYPGSV